MTDGRSWQGNWKVRMYERVLKRGHTSLTDFADARPTASLVELAEDLGKGDIAGAQILSGLFTEAERRNQVTRFVRGVLVRMLSQSLPQGWPAVMDDASRFAVAKALGRWSGYTPESHQQRAEQLMAALRAHPPPPGWRPLGPDDALLLTLLPDNEA
ncbi:NUDIX hydrolase [Corallococcus exiguus]|uniref:NUDIX hydrolase n=1 Tax=Corallococcus exiguus TaxID=83462 RepID=UPI0015602706|nr:NUDIX hydrolase [Corallococcus exiguus]NRD62275.1 NUDIX hydrolase [Corallococcus exiguus]